MVVCIPRAETSGETGSPDTLGHLAFTVRKKNMLSKPAIAWKFLVALASQYRWLSRNISY